MPAIDLDRIKAQAKAKILHVGTRVLVCCGTGCAASGSRLVYDAFLSLADAKDGLYSVSWTEKDNCRQRLNVVSETGCHGLCQMGPLVIVQPSEDKHMDEVFYCRVSADDVSEIVDKTLTKGELVERLLYHHPEKGTPYRNSKEIPFYAKQTRLALRDCGHVEPENLEEYIYRGGYAAARKAITKMSPKEVCEEVLSSGLRGRGGAGYPTGKKWLATLQVQGDTKYVVCNGDEGDPGAFMDRSLMEGDPHRVLEGSMIAGFATGATYGYFYIRTEYPLAIRRMRKAIEDARAMGVLGENAFGSTFDFDCEVVEGAGAFVCGEETALLASIEGQRGMPRPKPPFPAQCGLYGKPTVVNNVETLGTIRYIIEEGARAFRKYGTQQSPGTKTFALTGRVRNTGLIEVPLGTTLREIVYDIGGGITGGSKFKAVQIGGPSGGCLGVEHLDMPLDFENLSKVGAMVGSGGIVVMDETTCIVEISRYFMQFTQMESCGKCVLCREGTKQMLGILQDVTEGKSQPGDLELLEETARAVKTASLCGLGKSAPNPVLSTLNLFKSEYLAHTDRHYCPAGVCQALRSFTIDPESCKGCTLCVSKCPVGAIEGERRKAHKINLEKCIKCGACVTACKFKAVRAG